MSPYDALLWLAARVGVLAVVSSLAAVLWFGAVVAQQRRYPNAYDHAQFAETTER